MKIEIHGDVQYRTQRIVSKQLAFAVTHNKKKIQGTVVVSQYFDDDWSFEDTDYKFNWKKIWTMDVTKQFLCIAEDAVISEIESNPDLLA